MLRSSLLRPGLSGWCALIVFLLTLGRNLPGIAEAIDRLWAPLTAVPSIWSIAGLLMLAVLALGFHLVRLSLLLACSASFVLLATAAPLENPAPDAPKLSHLLLAGHLLAARALPVRAARRGLTSLPTLWLVTGTGALLLMPSGAGAPWLAIGVPQLADQRPLVVAGLGLALLAAWLGRRATAGGQGATLVLALVLSVCWALLYGRPLELVALPLPTLLGILGLLVVLESLYGLAYLDELTGVSSRRALDDALRSPPRRYAVALVDIDHFKKINDRHGHDAGDQVLRAVARRLAAARGGQIYRYGGEEFVLLFRAHDRDEAAAEVDHLRKTVAAQPFTVRRAFQRREARATSRERRIRVRFSSGVADQRSGSPSTTLEAADRALYRAKRAGRNRVVVAKR